MEKVYKTAIYLRISRDEEAEKESGSISNQRDMLMSFIESRSDLEFIDEYSDDGYSGYDFNRPQFQQMISDVKKGKINCIVVKDFSRLGRNFLRTEEYMQRIFPELGVRFISVSDCYDSTKEQSESQRLANPIINLMNEYHVMENSQKVRKVFEHYRQIGKYIGGQTVYGYVLEDKKLKIDPKAAKVVKMIFNLRIEGMSNQGIANYLNELGISSPLEYKIENGKPIATSFRKGEKAMWASPSVRRILENPVYIGTLIQGKTTTASYRDKRRFKRDPSELIAFKNAHDAIISETTFLIVQDLLKRDTWSHIRSGEKIFPFTGICNCGNCGKVLHHYHMAGREDTWRCDNVECKDKAKIKEKLLTNAVFETLKKHIEIVLSRSEPVGRSEFIDRLNCTNFELIELKKQSEQLKKSKKNLAVQRENGVISESDYAEMCEFYDGKIAGVESRSEKIRGEKISLLDCIDEIKDKYKKYLDSEELTRGMVVTFMDKIEVFGKSKIRIHFRYEDFFEPYSDGDIDGS